jgi:peptidoglycan/LPS O-acetylase OafA/YrhL
MTDQTVRHTSGGAYFPCLNAVRAVAALSVMATHCAYWTGRYDHGPAAGLLARLDLGVAVFFVLSGFLLFRPYAVAMATGRPLPSTGRYLTRRLLRIAPAYLVVVGLTAALLSENWGRPAADWVRQATFTQIYGSDHLLHGLTQTWSLCTEITFYLCLPALAAGAVRLLGRRWRPGVLFAALGVLGLVNVGWFYLFHQLTGSVAASMGLWLPSHLIWFGAGMAVAVTSAHLTSRPAEEHGRLAVLPALADKLGTWWLISGALLLLASTPLAGTRSLLTLSTWDSVNRELLGAGIATAFIFPLVFRPEPVGVVRQVLAHGSLRWLGEISYSIFLVHVLVLDLAFRLFDWPLFTGSFLGVFATVLPLSVALAALLYRFVELPAMRWTNRSVRSLPVREAKSPDSTHAASAAARETTASDVTGSSLPA